MTTRRSLLAAACGTCAAALTGCAGYGPGRSAATAPLPPTSAATVPDPAAAPTSTSIPVADALAAAAAVPVGGGLVLADLDLVVTQPVEGEFAAFSATCTHQGCAVTEVVDGQIVCPCHGSTFSITDGAPTAGPAEQPLPPRAVSLQGGRIVLA
ncbi:Rieske (2Fe-2S) protein [Pseudonocardia broussonetiae]|uniref:Cytochrome bc1 complex Rieske iron-sulfur subunit n=1 Tax=Pseudonocardia broussonetiae TaxID=2736640 RepID=A0A6M6JN73_9PSEU|nr:Rieske (2Fe-2S) protein [Pseudonocardia broussonetiae]QJY48756.1 Rieske (2Fe-2S) protein [Pseudonocardia broussonetiae]